VSGLVHRLLDLPGWLVLLVAGAVVLAEDALFVGFVLPGETAAVLAGVAASLGHAPLALVLGVVVLAAVVGDSVGYEVGRHYGTRVVASGRLDRHRDRLDRAQSLLVRRGGAAVFLGRWTAFFRAVMPALAGSARMPYPRFLAFNAAGGVLWGTAVVLIGYLAGRSYATVERAFGWGAAAVVALVVVTALVAWRVRKSRVAPVRTGETGPEPRAGDGMPRT
jgi:membrane protein DedA with SNARE-associated domain